MILVVEDDADIRRDLSDILRDEGYEVMTAANGAEALTKLQQDPRPCLILLDLMMPVMDGWSLRKRLLREPHLATVPVMILSGADQADEAATAMGAVGCLSKPFELDALLGAIQQYC